MSSHDVCEVCGLHLEREPSRCQEHVHTEPGDEAYEEHGGPFRDPRDAEISSLQEALFRVAKAVGEIAEVNGEVKASQPDTIVRVVQDLVNDEDDVRGQLEDAKRELTTIRAENERLKDDAHKWRSHVVSQAPGGLDDERWLAHGAPSMSTALSKIECLEAENDRLKGELAEVDRERARQAKELRAESNQLAVQLREARATVELVRREVELWGKEERGEIACIVHPRGEHVRRHERMEHVLASTKPVVGKPAEAPLPLVCETCGHDTTGKGWKAGDQCPRGWEDADLGEMRCEGVLVRAEQEDAQRAPARSGRVQMSDEYESADYYDCQDRECLEHESPQAAIAERLAEMAPASFEALPDDRIAALLEDIRRIAPLKVTAYKRATVDLGDYAQQLAEHLYEILDEDEMLAHPDGDRSVLEDVEPKELEDAIAKAIEPFSSRAKPWHCEKVATREYSAEEIEAMMRKLNPGWFEIEEVDHG